MLNKRKLIKAVLLQDSMQSIFSMDYHSIRYYLTDHECSVELMRGLKIRLTDCAADRGIFLFTPEIEDDCAADRRIFLFTLEIEEIVVLELRYDTAHPFWITSKKHFRIPSNIEEYLNFWADEQLQDRKEWEAECKKQKKIDREEAQKMIDKFTLDDLHSSDLDTPIVKSFRIGDTVFVSNEKSWVSREHKSFFGTVVDMQTHPDSETYVIVRFPENGSTVEWTYHPDELSLKEEVLDLTLGEFCCLYNVCLDAEYLPKTEEE